MKGSVFVDTNVLVYSVHEGDAPHKLAQSVRVLGALERERTYLSAQVIGEFLSACKKKLADVIEPTESREIALGLAEEFRLAPLDGRVVSEALRACERYGLDYFDAQVWAAARMSGCVAILTEDTHGDEIEGVAYVDPFAEGFDLEAWLEGAG